MAATLLVTNEELSDDSLEVVLDALNGRRGAKPEVRVVSPALATSALKQQAGDIDEAIPPARRRLDATLERLRRAGVEASGEVGDSDPVMAISDELQKERVDRILLISHADEQSAAYGEKKLLERVKREFEPPVTELRVSGGGERVTDRREASAGAERAREGRRLSPNLPPIRTQDGLGLLVAVLGTVALFVIAASCGSPGGDREGTSLSHCGAVYLLAGGFFLINLGHVGALLLMESVGYRGPFERFFARLSLIGTPIAIAVATALTLLQ
jgi:hypothetical protein